MGMNIQEVTAEIVSLLDSEFVKFGFLNSTDIEQGERRQMIYVIVIALVVGFASGFKLHVFVFALATAIACVLAFVADLGHGTALGRAIVESVAVAVALQAGYVIALIATGRR